jgi:hypothetical protein
MVFPFGVGVGDFVAVLDLVATVYNALDDRSDDNKEYRDLHFELDAFKHALEHVKEIACSWTVVVRRIC